jgi:hypothetical protein
MLRKLIIVFILLPQLAVADVLIEDCPFTGKYLACEKERELKQLDKHKEIVVREGNQLTLVSSGGEIIRKNSPKGTEGVTADDGSTNANYYFYQYLDKQEVYVIVRSLWEGSDFELISRNTNKSIFLQQIPISSPNGELHFAFITDIYEPHTYHVVVYDISKSQLREAFVAKLDYNYVMNAKWKNNTEVELTYDQGFSDKLVSGDKVGRLVKSNGAWKYHETKKE